MAQNLQRLMYAESEIDLDLRNLSLPTREPELTTFPTDDSIDNQSMASYATSVYTDIVDDDGDTQSVLISQAQKRSSNKFKYALPSNPEFRGMGSIGELQEAPSIKDSFGRQVLLEQGNYLRSPDSPMQPTPQIRKDGAGLSKTLHDSQHRIRESIEMDHHGADSYHSNSSERKATSRLSVITKQSVITLKMPSTNERNRIRLKCYLPMTNDNEGEVQIIQLFVYNRCTMENCIAFLEQKYPHKMLKGKIKQLLIADEDGDIDDDYPPLNNGQDITALNIQTFWIDRMFADGHRPSQSDDQSKHKDTIKEPLIAQNVSADEDDDDVQEAMYDAQSSIFCCWCCGTRKKRRMYDNNEADIDEDDDSHHVQLVKVKVDDEQYEAPAYEHANEHQDKQKSGKANESHLDVAPNLVQFASV